MRHALLALALFVPVLGLHAQDAGTLAAFEVASIKVRTDPAAGPGPQSTPDRYSRTNVSLRNLIQDVYGRQPYEIVGGPDWLGTVRFDVSARAPSVVSPEQMRLMMQHLLVERFALRTHTETRELLTYALRLARRDGRLGPRVTKTSVDCAAIEADRNRRGESASVIPSQRGERPTCTAFVTTKSSTSPSGLSITMRHYSSGTSMNEFAAFLSRLAAQVGRPVIDYTGLQGDFDIDLEFAVGGNSDEAPSIFTAVQEQLGLKLEATKGPVAVLVVDSVERPTPD